MLFLVGIIIVTASIIIGYTMHAGDLSLLWQPNELIIILGSGIGGTIISNPPSVIYKTLRSFKTLFKGMPFNKSDYLELLLFSFNAFRLMKIKGMPEIESHIDNTHDSYLFQQAPSIRQDEYMIDFVKDNLRLLTMGVDNSHQFEDAINKEIEVYASTAGAPGKALLVLSDALPALGIVAAVLGVIVTMRSIMEPPDVLGSLIAAALVGTFTGVLLSYGFFGPMAQYLVKYAEYKLKYLECIKVGFIGYLNGNPPIIIAEFMRKSIPEDVRPSFYELDAFIGGNSMKIMNNS